MSKKVAPQIEAMAQKAIAKNDVATEKAATPVIKKAKETEKLSVPQVGCDPVMGKAAESYDVKKTNDLSEHISRDRF